MEAVKPKAKKKSSSKKPLPKPPSVELQEVEPIVDLASEEREGPASPSPTVSPLVSLSEYDQPTQDKENHLSKQPEQSIVPEAGEDAPSQDSGKTPIHDEKTDAELCTDFAPTAPPPCVAPIATLSPMLYPDLSQLKLEANIRQTIVPDATNAIKQSCISVPRTRTLYLQCIQQMEDISLQTDREHLNALEQQFVVSENPHAVAKDPSGYHGDLNLCIQSYRDAYHSYCDNVKKQAVTHQEISSLRHLCWNFRQVKFSGSGFCDDGRMVHTSRKSRVASLNHETCKEMKSSMASLVERCVSKAKDAFIHLHHSRAMVEKNVCDPPKPGQDCTLVWRIKLRIVGNALRNEMHQNGCDQGEQCEYVQDLRKWFLQLGTLLLRTGNVDDRVWLMFHLLRFPNGIGTWAHVLVHPIPFASVQSRQELPESELQAVLTLIHVLLRPIIERQTFLAPVEDSAGPTQTPHGIGTSAGKPGDTFEWVDSDGEDSATDNRIRPIKESDLLALLEQIPFQRLFDTITARAMHRVLSGDVKQLPTTEMLRLITFANKVVAILGAGLSTYGGVARYSHFVQRLALLINDTVKFVSDVLRLYRDSHGTQATEEVELVQVHFDTLVYGAARCIYSGGVSLSRHLSTLPFALLSSRACWWVFRCLLNRNFSLSPDFEADGKHLSHTYCTAMEQFARELPNEAPHDLYNVLKPFVDLALARDSSFDREFIATITKTLFELLASVSANEMVCAEIIMEQIHIILEQNSIVLSVLLETLSTHDTQQSQITANVWQMKGTRLLEVFSGKKKLVMRWHPTETDIYVLLQMLLNYARAHIYHKLALGLLMYINYGDISELCVPLQIQTRIAYSVVAAFRKNKPAAKVDPDSAEGMENKSYEERCLFVLLQLRVHALDQPLHIVRHLMSDPSTADLQHIAALDQFPDVKAAIDERCPVACLTALLTTTTGHWVPVFCQDGVNLLKLLLEQRNLDTIVVRCLELISLLFIECPQALSGNERFIALLAQLVESDDELDWARHTTDEQQQSSFAHDLLSQAKIGKMGSMLVSQAVSYWRCGYATPPLLICMWCDWLTQLSSWTNNAKVLRLLNVLAAISFGHAEAWNALRHKMRPFFKSLSQAKQKQPGIHSLWSKIIGTEPPLLYGTLPSDCVALALLVYGIEHQQLELETELWTKLLRMLKRNKAIKLDAALREVNVHLRIREEDFCPSVDSLVFFKVARFLVRANVEHPLYLAVCQLFFTIYLTRVTDVGDEVHGVSDRLYGYDTTLMEKMKQKLCNLELHYHNMQETNNDAIPMLRLVKAFQLWLIDTDLNRFAMDDAINLPIQYDKDHLQATLTGVNECWPECLNRQSTLTIHRIMTERWYNLYRVVPNPPSADDKPPAIKQLLSPVQAIQRRLENCYTNLPQIPITESNADSQDLIDALQKPPNVRVKRITESLRIVKQFIDKTYWSQKAELDQRQHDLCALYQQLYVNEDKQIIEQAKCSILYCTGAASVKLHTKCAAIDKTVEDRIAGRLNGLQMSMKMAINIPPYIMKHTILLRELWNSLFIDYCTETEQVTVQVLNGAIRTMLRTLLHEVSDANFVPPLTFVVRFSMDTYKSDLTNLLLEEVCQLFAGAVEDGRKPSNVIVAMLDNIRIPVRALLQVYSQLVKQKHGNLERNLFVELFDEKLNLYGWLMEHNVTTEDVDQFAMLIVIGLRTSHATDSVSLVRSEEQAETDKRFCKLLISHLVLLANSTFPQHFGKMVQHTLNAYSEFPTLPPMMLLELLNLLRSRALLCDLQLGMLENSLQQAHSQFADSNRTEPVLSVKVLEYLMVTVTEHFARQHDMAYPWNGIYRRHGAYVEVLGMLLGMFSYSLLAYGVKFNRNRPDVCDHLLPVVCRMFEPWVVPYGAATSTQPVGLSSTFSYTKSAAASGNESSRHFNNDKAKWMFSALLHTIEYAIEKVADDCSQILFYFLNWYLEWFVNPQMMISALYVYNTLVLDLPWERLQPSEMLIERMHSLLEHNSPECHEFLACVFVRCCWQEEKHKPVPAWLQRNHASTLAICVRIAYEPVIRSEAKLRTAMVRLLQYFARLSWETLHVAELTPALDWFVMTAEADSMLRTPKSPCRELDDALLEFLEIVAGMRFNEANRLVSGGMQLLKRKLYISVAVRMLINAGRASGMVATVKPELAGSVRQLLRTIGVVLEGLPLARDTGTTDCPRSTETRAMTVELLTSIKKWQTEYTLSLFIDELIHMLETDTNARLLTRYVLELASLLDSPAVPWLRLLEKAVGHSLCPNGTVFASTWLQILNAIGYTAIERWQNEVLLQNCFPLCLELRFLHRWAKERCDPVGQLRCLNQLLATLSELKISEPVEYQLYPLWCTLTYSLVTMQPEPDAAFRTAIGLFGTVSENSTYGVVGMLKKILWKDKQTNTRISATRCLIGCAFAVLLAQVYARRAPKQTSDTPETDDYSDTGNGAAEPFTLPKLWSAPEKRATRERILSAAMEHFKSTCGASGHKDYHGRVIAIVETVCGTDEPYRIFQHAKDVILLLDSRPEPLLNTLLEAIATR
ncbi:ectopic P granules protein 5 homolog [Anopheles marshallii]|uniref:ectopic P granules protein 5 homolog n=1 Tax=Anopheles marshallii TaxID=1521116 RepID=UPI00237BE0AC|nr:ectopic P granules protein 5 homolog [Anopheles marshallii]